MAESSAEAFVRKLFESRFGVRLRKIPESKAAETPDYELLDGDARAAVLEVKNLIRTPRTKANGWTDEGPEGGYSPLRRVSRIDNAPSRVCDHIYKAHAQLSTCLEPKVLVFVNDDHLIDVHDLSEAITGAMIYGNGEFGYINDLTSTKAAHGRIADKAYEIDLYVWIDRYVYPVPAHLPTYFRQTTDIGERLANRYFGCVPAPTQPG